MFAGLPGRGNKDLIDEEFRCKTPSREALEISQGERTVPELAEPTQDSGRRRRRPSRHCAEHGSLLASISGDYDALIVTCPLRFPHS